MTRPALAYVDRDAIRHRKREYGRKTDIGARLTPNKSVEKRLLRQHSILDFARAAQYAIKN
jgi:hypothetical protein